MKKRKILEKDFFKKILFITKKELESLFLNPAAYITLVVFLVILEFLFFSTVIRQKAVLLDSLFDHIPWLFLFLIPAVTMSSISQEKKEGTIEFYLTQPVSEKHFLIGKFLSNYIFILIGVILTLPAVVSLSQYGSLDWGQVAGQYIASALLAFGLTGLGVFMSSVVKSQVSAFLLSALTSFFLMILGFTMVTETVPLWTAAIFERISTLPHFTSLSRGVVDLRDLLYFLGLGTIFLTLSYLPLIKFKFAKTAKIYRSLRIVISILVIIELAVITLGEKIPGRIDLTERRLYTLSDTTKDIIKDTDDIINITIYVSQSLPAEVEPIFRDIQDILRDYKTIGGGDISLKVKYPDKDEEIENEAVSVGVTPFQFNTRTNEELSSKKGYLGISIQYLDKQEVLPFVNDTSDLEYQLTSLINKITLDEKPKVVFVNTAVSHSDDYQIFREELEKLYEVVPMSISTDEDSIPEDTAAIILPGPNEEFSDSAKTKFKEYLDNGGSVFALLDGVNVDMQTLAVSINENSLKAVFEEYGLELKSDLVYDLKSNELVSVGGGATGSYLINYPFWIRGEASTGSVVTDDLGTINFSWASSVGTQDEVSDNITIETLISSSDYAGVQVDGLYDISPNSELSDSENELNKRDLAKSMLRKIDDEKNTRVVLVGDSDTLSDNMVQTNPNNLIFGLNAAEWLTQGISLSEIRKKNRDFDALVFENDGEGSLLKYGNIIGIAILVSGAGIYVLYKRNKKTKLKYEKE